MRKLAWPRKVSPTSPSPPVATRTMPPASPATGPVQAACAAAAATSMPSAAIALPVSRAHRISSSPSAFARADRRPVPARAPLPPRALTLESPLLRLRLRDTHVLQKRRRVLRDAPLRARRDAPQDEDFP